MADLQRQIGDHARATAEASPRSTVGDVIQPGQPIPDDVTWVEDEDRDVWTLTARGHWHFPGNVQLCDDGRCAILLDKPADFAPLTVTAVREQPAEPHNAHEAPAQPTCPAHGAHPHRIGATCLDCPICRPPAEPEPQQADEPALLDLAHDFQPYQWDALRCGYTDGDGEMCGHSADEHQERPNRVSTLAPQQPDALPLLDLVRQYGAERQRMGSASITGSAPAVHEHKMRAAALLARIAALVPQQPDLFAQVMAELGVDKPEDAPIAVKADRDALAALRAIREELVRDRDEACAEVERLKRDYVTGKTWREQREAHLAEQRAAQSDPMVLRLPEVPKDAVALVGRSTGTRYPLHEESGGWRNPNDGGAPWKLTAVLDFERPEGVRVELAPPREPRTWPQLATPEDVKRVRGASGQIWTFADEGWALRWGGDSRSFYELQEIDGPLTEVLDDKPGGER